MPSEQEKFFGFLNTATAPAQWAVRQIRDWLKLIGAVAMLIIGVVCYPFWISFWWAIGGTNMEQVNDNVYIARVSTPFVADFRLYHGSPKGDPPTDPSFKTSVAPAPCDSQPKLAAIDKWDEPMYRSYRRAKYNMEDLCRFVLPPANPHPDLSAAPVVSLWFIAEQNMTGRIVGMCPGVRWSGMAWCEYDKDQVPAVSRFGGLTEGQRRAVKLLESTLSDDFWLRVAHANGVTDDAVVRTAAKNSRIFNDKSTNEGLPGISNRCSFACCFPPASLPLMPPPGIAPCENCASPAMIAAAVAASTLCFVILGSLLPMFNS
jgi:hypothetical protein